MGISCGRSVADLDVLPAALLFRQRNRLFQSGTQIARRQSGRHLPSDGKKIVHQVIQPPNLFLDVLQIALQFGPAAASPSVCLARI